MKNTDALPSKAVEVLCQMTEAEWEELWKRLLYFTIKNYGYFQQIAGIQVEDLVQGAILDVLTGVRIWHPTDSQQSEKGISLFVFLCYTIRSKVSHLVERGRRVVHLDEDIESHVALDHLHSERQKIESDRDATYNDLSRRILQLVSDDALLIKIVKIWIETPDLKPREIADMLGLPAKDMQNAQKRLIRRTRKLIGNE